MNPRACLLLALLVMSPAWSQERSSFDLGNEAVKKIVRATAATQYAVVQVPQDAPVKAQPKAVEFVAPVAVATRTPTVTKLPEARPRDGFLSTLIDTLTEDDSVTYAELHDQWLRCQSRDDLKTTAERAASCPGRTQETRSVTGNPADFKTVPAP